MMATEQTDSSHTKQDVQPNKVTSKPESKLEAVNQFLSTMSNYSQIVNQKT